MDITMLTPECVADLLKFEIVLGVRVRMPRAARAAVDAERKRRIAERLAAIEAGVA